MDQFLITTAALGGILVLLVATGIGLLVWLCGCAPEPRHQRDRQALGHPDPKARSAG